MPRTSSASNNQKRSAFNVRQAVGNNIKIRRSALGWSQQELADRFGVSRAAISHCETGTGEINAGDLPRLADILGMSLLEFYEGPFFDLRANSIEDRSWAIDTAAALLKKHGLLLEERETIEKNLQNSSLWNKDGSLNSHNNQADMFLLDDWLGVSYRVPLAGNAERDNSSVIRLAHMAGHFLCIARQDQDIMSRVAEALYAQTEASPVSLEAVSHSSPPASSKRGSVDVS